MWPNKEGEKKPDEKPEVKASSVEDFLAKMGDLLNPIKQSIEAQNNRLQAIEEARKPKIENPEIPSVLDNEEDAFNRRMGPLAAETIKTNARITESEVLADVRAQGWEEFIPEIKSLLATTPITVKAGDGYEAYCRNVVDMVIGKNARKDGLKRKGSSFILEDASSASENNSENSVGQADREWLNFEVVTSKGKHVKRAEFLKRMGIDVSNPDTLKAARATWDNMQVIS